MNEKEFIKQLQKLDINIDLEQLNKLDTYYHILTEENKKYNLTAITSKKEIYLKHFYDSITISKIIKLTNQTLCDIGTGAGFPGVVLQILYPTLKVTLIESNKKKCNFLNILKKELNLVNLTIINQRAEEYSINNREVFDIVTSRAVAPLKHLLEYSIPLVKEQGFFIAMKSNIENEEKNIDNYYKKLDITLSKKIIFYLPIENSLRTLLMYKKSRKTSKIYPRRYSEIKKKEI